MFIHSFKPVFKLVRFYTCFSQSLSNLFWLYATSWYLTMLDKSCESVCKSL